MMQRQTLCEMCPNTNQKNSIFWHFSRCEMKFAHSKSNFGTFAWCILLKMNFVVVNFCIPEFHRLIWNHIAGKAKGRISKRVFQENKARQIFRKTDISYPLIRTRTYAYQGVRNIPFSENLACCVFLKLSVWDSSFCLITDDIKDLWLRISAEIANVFHMLAIFGKITHHRYLIRYKVRLCYLYIPDVFSTFGLHDIADGIYYTYLAYMNAGHLLKDSQWYRIDK